MRTRARALLQSQKRERRRDVINLKLLRIIEFYEHLGGAAPIQINFRGWH